MRSDKGGRKGRLPSVGVLIGILLSLAGIGMCATSIFIDIDYLTLIGILIGTVGIQILTSSQ